MTLVKEIKKDTNNWKYMLCAWTRRINTVRMLILPKAIHRFNVILMKFPQHFFAEVEKNTPKVYIGPWKNPNGERNPEKE